jgi:hypothetical protein
VSRATVARGLRLLASLVAGDDPVADAIREAVEARRVAERTREVVRAWLREGAATMAQSAEAGVAAGTLTRAQVDGWGIAAPSVERARALLRGLAGEG